MPISLDNAIIALLLRIIRKDTARIVFFCVGTGFLLLIMAGSPAAADWNPLVSLLATDGFDRRRIEALFNRPEARFEPDAMADKIKAILRARAQSPDEKVRMKTAVRESYLSKLSIGRANSYAAENRAIMENANAIYGVPEEIIVSIMLIETNLGRNTGRHLVFNRLASMALSGDLESVRHHIGRSLLTPENAEFARRRCREKGDWAYNELKALLQLADRDSFDPLAIRGSLYGAIGLCQFMPSNVFLYGMDADKDGRVNLFTKADALHSIANYLRGHGWRQGMDRAGEHQAIFGYNNSTVYANTILAVAERLRERRR